MDTHNIARYVGQLSLIEQIDLWKCASQYISSDRTTTRLDFARNDEIQIH